MTTALLTIKWTVSRGQDTYGYNICSLWRNGVKVGTCMGGGYDMLGTSFGNYMEVAYQDKLKALFAAHEHEAVDYAGFAERIPCFNGMTRDNKSGAIHLDGGCGYDCMVRIAEAMGFNYDRGVAAKGGINVIILTGEGA